VSFYYVRNGAWTFWQNATQGWSCERARSRGSHSGL